ncbi:Xaa-Pro aminopeptidase [Pancytospora philotis]|nr:Xaa-Pro aminopeptidase [Pancytospora philotis]
MHLEKYFAGYSIDAYITPIADNHLNEFVNPQDNAVERLTGFTGTSGTAAEFRDFCGLLTDGRYYEQATNELSDYQLVKTEEQSLPDLIIKHKARKVGADASLFSYSEWVGMEKKLKQKGIALVDIAGLLEKAGVKKDSKEFKAVADLEEYIYTLKDGKIDLRKDQEGRGAAENPKLLDSAHEQASMLFSEQFISSLTRHATGEDTHDGTHSVAGAIIGSNVAGSSRRDKLRRVRALLDGADGIIITELDTVAWLFNLRGRDVAYNSVFYAYAYITQNESFLFTDGLPKLAGVTVKPYNAFDSLVESLKDKRVLISSDCNARIGLGLPKKEFTSALRAAQAKKNIVELYGMLMAYLSDGAALVRLFEWIEDTRGVTEAQIADKLVKIKQGPHFVTPSFASIVAFGPNSSQMHHRSGNAQLEDGQMVLLDTGSQYVYGTTDITRSLSLQPTDEQRKKYTYVLKAVLVAKMLPRSRVGAEAVDEAARGLLAEHGITYNSGTSHGVGAGLFVHESPPFRAKYGDKIEVNNVFTVEPGYYEEGKFGVRIEDTVFFSDSTSKYPLVNLAYVPLHLKLIDTGLLTDKELEYLNWYNRLTRSLLLPRLGGEAGKRYLLENTEKLAK